MINNKIAFQTFSSIIISASSLLITSEKASSISITLDFDTLPSQQGWSFTTTGGGVSENNVFSVDGNTLSQNSLGLGFSSSATPRYELANIIDPSLPFTIEARARILNEEGNLSTPTGFIFSAFLPTESFGFSIGTNRINDIFGNAMTTSINTTEFHDYLLRVNPGVGYQFFVDGEFIASGSPRVRNRPNILSIGDRTSVHNAQAETTYYRFTQEVPEPLTILGTLTAGGIGMMLKKKKEQNEIEE